MITDIKIQDWNYKCDWEERISGLKKINIFLWANNSWKSRFMRGIFSHELEWNTLTTIQERIKIEAIFEIYRDQFKRYAICSGDFVNFHELYNQFLSKCVSSSNLAFSKNLIGKIKLGWLKEDFYEKYNFKKVYIPMLRGLRPLDWSNQLWTYWTDPYKKRTHQDYTGIWEEIDIFTWLDLFDHILEMKNSNEDSDRDLIHHFEIFLSSNFFENQKIEIISWISRGKHGTNQFSKDVLSIKIWDSKTMPIYHLWDWIQTIIINTFPLFKYKWEELLLFIEEPEMTLHPWMQRKLLEVLLTSEYSKNVQIFMTTHSNHMLDILLDYEDDVATYSFKKESDDEYLIQNNTKNKEILDLLWVRNSSVFLSNCIIWVEGISDRLYIKKFLELYYESLDWKNYEEDKHYSIVEYGWGNITHFNFDEEDQSKITTNIKAIQGNNFLLADNDLSKPWEKKFDRLVNLKDILWEDNMYYDFPEIENLISYEVYNSYFLDNQWTNWESKREGLWTKKDFDDKIYNTDIWAILKELFIWLKDEKESEKFIDWNDISIIWNKSKIAWRMIKYMENYDDLWNKAKELTEKIHKFIEKNNS